MGRSIVETLDQKENWYGQDGRPYKLQDMEESHLENTLAFLRRRASDLYEHKLWYEQRLLVNAPSAVFNDWCRGIDQDPEEWLESTPLVQAMEHELRGRNVIEGEVVAVQCQQHSIEQ